MQFLSMFFPDKNMVSEQASQRKKNEPEEAAAFTAGLYDHPHLPGPR